MRIFGMGVPELLIILAVALLIFGPKNLPKLGASLGKTVKSIREGMEDDDPEEKKSAEVIAEEAKPADPAPAPETASKEEVKSDSEAN